MTIKELIKSKLRPIGDAIREKNGSTELIPIDDMPQAIRDIQGGGGATVTKQGETVTLSGEYDGSTLETELVIDWQGTQVPGSGYIEKLYFNTNLSKEEVNEILLTLDTIKLDESEDNFYIVAVDSNLNAIAILQDISGNDYNRFQIYKGNFKTFESEWIYLGIGASNDGWYANEVEFNAETLLNDMSLQYNQVLQNDKLSKLISTTPFTQENTINIKSLLEEKKLPLEIKVNVESESVNVVKSGGTVVPNSGYVEKVYFNTSLSVEEVDNILANIEYIDYLGVNRYGVIAFGDNSGFFISKSRGTITYNIAYAQLGVTGSEVEIYSSRNGWADFTSYEINAETFTETLASQLGQKMQNDKLINLISTTPFENQVIKELSGDYEAVDLTFNELPSVWQDRVVPNTGYVEKIYFNTSLSVDEVNNILDSLDYTNNIYGIALVKESENAYLPLYVEIGEKYGLSGYAIRYTASLFIFVSNQEIVDFISDNLGVTTKVGWNIENSLITVYRDVVPSYQDNTYGTQNDKLTSLISIEAPLENTINVESYLDNKQMPLSIKVNVESQEPNLQEKEITENGEYVADEGYDGFSKVTVNVGGESINLMKTLLDSKKEASYLFRRFRGESVDDLISYSDTKNVTKMDYMFNDCSALTTIPQLDTSNVTSMSNMFNSCSVLKTIPQLDTSKVTNMSKMFYNCWNLTEIPQLDTSKVTDMNAMFFCASSGDGNKYLKTITLTDTSNVTHMNSMFDKCRALETISKLDMIKIKDVYYADSMFRECMSLTNLTLLNIKVNLQVGSGDGTGSWDWGHLLTLESLINTVKECINVGKARTLTMGSANLEKIANTYVKFTDTSQTTIPTNEKGDVVVCESTDTGAMLLKDYALLKNWTLA